MACGCAAGTSSFFSFWRLTGTTTPAPNQNAPLRVGDTSLDLAWVWTQPSFPAIPCTDPLPVTLYYRCLEGPDGPSGEMPFGFNTTYSCAALTRVVKCYGTTNVFTTPSLTVVQVQTWFCRPGLYEVWGERDTCGHTLFASTKQKKAIGRLIVRVV